MLHRNWHPILDRFRTKYYEAIVKFSNEIYFTAISFLMLLMLCICTEYTKQVITP